MDPQDGSAAPLVVPDQVHVPKGAIRVQRLNGQAAGQLLQVTLAPDHAAGHGLHVVADVELGIELVLRPSQVLDYPLAEATEQQEPFLHGRPQLRQRNRLGQQEHAGHHHEIGVAVHPQPRDVRRVHGLAADVHDLIHHESPPIG
jgi:hypothetical protein